MSLYGMMPWFHAFPTVINAFASTQSFVLYNHEFLEKINSTTILMPIMIGTSYFLLWIVCDNMLIFLSVTIYIIISKT